ncbi:glyoxal oxidase [Ceratobasidium sp. AG-Ba]|nr:glyoxal oxidase [Ceratobasidium sp. AG-Ba]
MTGNGRWISLTLRKQKQKGGKKIQQVQQKRQDQSDSETDLPVQRHPPEHLLRRARQTRNKLFRYLGIMRFSQFSATRYIFTEVFSRGSREYTLDDFYSLALDKLDRFICLKPCDVQFADNDDSSEDDGDDDDDDNEDDSEGDYDQYSDSGDEVAKPPRKHKKDVEEIPRPEEVKTSIEEPAPPQEEPEDEVDELTQQAQAFLGVSKDAARSPEEALSTPLPGEYWAQKAHENSDNRGKMLRRDGFGLAEERYETYKPVLKEVERILSEAGLDAEEMKRVGAGGGTSGGSRNRR